MTHTLNRTGLSEGVPGEEIVVLCMIHQAQKEQKAAAMQRIARIVLSYEPLNYIGQPLGLDKEAVIPLTAVTGIITAVFTDMEAVRRMTREIKSQNLGVSVVLSGLFTDVNDICRSAGLKEHTYHISLGTCGCSEKLPDSETLDITTQCGHALIAPQLVHHVVKQIRKEKMSLSEGAEMLITPCVCGIGNPERIQKTLARITAPPANVPK